MKKIRTKHLLAVLFYMIFIDALWIIGAAMPLYQNELGAISSQKPYFIQVVIAIYGLLFGGFYMLILKNMANQSPISSMGSAAFLGLTVYGVYTLTNYTIFPSWSFMLVITDMLWGAFLFGSTAALMFWLKKYDR
jgi:uncharacterized membrane protein